MTQMTQKVLKIGVIGLGRGFMLSLPTFINDPRVSLIAAFDPREQAIEQFMRDFGGKDVSARAYRESSEFFANKEIDLIYVASPHQYHEEHVLQAVRAGKHVLVEKPMALDVAECENMIAAAQAAGVHLFVGPSHGFDEPILLAKELIDSGDFGQVKMITMMNFTDFNYRARRPEELNRELGGGVAFSQAAHQIDIVRLLAGSAVTSVRATLGDWDRSRPTDGAYAALLQFENSVVATMTYSGYAHFNATTLCDDVNEAGFPVDPQVYGESRRKLIGMTPEDELQWKDSRTYGAGVELDQVSKLPPYHEHFGFCLVSCEGADLRTRPSGVEVYGDIERKTMPCSTGHTGRSGVISEVYNTIVNHEPPIHTGRWGLDTLEVCHALIRSSERGQEVHV